MIRLGYHKLKYPTITTQETALKFLALQMKANNPNKNELYRQKYKKKVSDFIDGCELTKTINEENKKRGQIIIYIYIKFILIYMYKC